MSGGSSEMVERVARAICDQYRARGEPSCDYPACGCKRERVERPVKAAINATNVEAYRHELWRRETGTSYANVSDANPNGTFSKRHCLLCDAETAAGGDETTPIPHRADCLLFGYEPKRDAALKDSP